MSGWSWDEAQHRATAPDDVWDAHIAVCDAIFSNAVEMTRNSKEVIWVVDTTAAAIATMNAVMHFLHFFLLFKETCKAFAF